MTSNTHAVSRLPLSGPADRERLSPLQWISIAVVFAAAALLRQIVPLNTDVSWLLTVGERVLDGQRLYVDIQEVNPPMAVLAYLPGIALARLLGLDPKAVIDGQMLLLAAASLLVTWRILRLSSRLDHTNWALAVWAAAVLTILPMHVFGQREHIATIVFLPALAVYVLRCDRERIPFWAVITAGAGAGITLAFKPFFAAPAFLCIILTAVRANSWRTLFAPENLIAGMLVIAFSCYTYLAYPEYFTITYSLVRDVYLSWSAPVAALLFNSATLVWSIALLYVLYAYRKKTGLDSAALTVLLASLGFAISFLLQRKGWPYQSYPMVAVALLGMGYVTSKAPDMGSDRRRFDVAAMSVMAATFLIGSLWFNRTVYVGPIESAIAGLKTNPRILVLSGEAAIGHPLVRTVHGVWVSRQENLWIREFVRLTREHNSIDPATDAKLNFYLGLERSWLIEDFRRMPPDIVLIDNLRGRWGEWARADSELTQLLKPYSLVRTVDGIEVLRRTQ